MVHNCVCVCARKFFVKNAETISESHCESRVAEQMFNLTIREL